MLRSSSILFAVVALCLVAIAGCSKSPEDKLVGKWELDNEAFQAAMKAEMDKKAADAPEGMDELGAAMMESMQEMMAAVQFNMEFQKDGKIIVAASGMGPEKKDEGTWKVESVDGNKITLRLKVGEEEEETGTVVLVDDNTLELHPPEGEATAGGMEKIVLKRVK